MRMRGDQEESRAREERQANADTQAGNQDAAAVAVASSPHTLAFVYACVHVRRQSEVSRRQTREECMCDGKK